MAWPLWSSLLGDVLSNGFPNDTAVVPGGAANQVPLGLTNVKASGNLWMQTPAGGKAPAGTGSGYIVALATIPANAFDAANRNVTISANGNFAANGNNKAISIVVNPTAPAVGSVVSGGTTIAASGTVATNGSAWALAADIIKTGANGSNTQTALHQSAVCGSVVEVLTACQSLTLPENAAITVAIVINNTTTAGDATLWNFQGQWFN